MNIRSKVLAIIDCKAGSMFTLEYVTVTRVRGTNRVLCRFRAICWRPCAGVDGGFPLTDWISKPGAKIQKARGIDLRNAGIGLAYYCPYFNEAKFLVVVQGHNQALSFGQLIDC